MLHYVAVYGFDGVSFQIMDPENGSRKRIPAGVFRRKWSGIVVKLYPKNDASVSDGESLWRRMFSFMLEHWGKIAALFSLSMLLSLLGVATALILEKIVDSVMVKQVGTYGTPILYAVLLLFILNLSIGFLYNRLAIESMADMDAGILSRFSRRLLCLSLFQTSQFDAGSLMSRIADVPRIRNLFTDILVSFLVSLFTFITASFLAFHYSRVCAGVMFLFFPGYFILYRWCGRINMENGYKVASSLSSYQSVFVDFISSMPALSHFNTGGAAAAKLDKDYSSFKSIFLDGGRKNALLSLFSQMLSKGMVAVLLILGPLLVGRGELTLGRFVALYTMCSFIIQPLEHFTDLSANLAQARVSWRRIFEIIDIGEDKEERAVNEVSETSASYVAGEHCCNVVEFRDVSFGYVGRMPLMESVNIAIPSGKLTVLYGPNGCGKSTLAALMVGDYRPGGGRILFEGRDIGGMDLAHLRERVLVVSGSDMLWGGTLLENILCFEEPSELLLKRVERVVKSLGMDEFIDSLPQGLMTMVGGVSSVRLSNGQRQKVLLARAFMRVPSLLVLDEATGALDSESERAVLGILKNICRSGVGVLMISHNRGLLDEADLTIDFNRDILRN